MENTTYKIIEILSPELCKINSEYEIQLWSLTNLSRKVRLRNCVICRNKLTEKGYRPITNGYNRGDRICAICFTDMVVKYSETMQQLNSEKSNDK